MEKAIEIKRRAQRCIQNGDVDGALAEYGKLVAIEDSDPYNFVLLADLHFKRGDVDQAAQRYLAAVAAYEKTSLFKNAIAVCKKMMRLKLAPAKVLERLAALHSADGLGTEAALYYMQYAESLVRDNRPRDAAEALRKAFEASPDEVKALERLSEAWTMAKEPVQAARAMGEAAYAYAKAGRFDHVRRCRSRAEQLHRGTMATLASERGPVPGLVEEGPIGAPATLPGGGGARAEPVTSDEDAVAADEIADGANARDDGIEVFHGRSTLVPPSLPAALVGDDLEVFPGRPAPMGAADDEVDRDQAAEAEDEPLPYPIADDDAPQPPALDDETGGSAGIPSYSPLDETPQPAGPPGRMAGEQFAPPASLDGEESPPAYASPAADPRPTVAEIESLLARAQEHFRAGDRERAGQLLVEAALAYERIDRLENAASIFRSLARSAHATAHMLECWLANCVRRDDGREAAEVACELGDRAVSEGQLEDARRWFETACAHDPDNAVARRRLQRLGQVSPAAPLLRAVPPPADDDPPPADESGRVEMAVGRAEAVTFDLGALLVEFQRGIEAQLSGDAQSHYDLAMTYWEMGLIEQAMDSFRLASVDPTFAPRAAEMIGRCLLDQGRFEEATHEFQIALDAPDLPADAAIGLRYHLGLAQEAAGKLKEAVAEYERVFEQQANYSDVALKLRVLRKALEAA